MAKRQREWAARVRVQLIEKLGGKCVICGTCYELEFDHKEPRTWNCKQVSSEYRITLYKREAEAGKIQLLCRKCNARKGEPEPPPPTAIRTIVHGEYESLSVGERKLKIHAKSN